MQLGPTWDAVGVSSFGGSDNGQFVIAGGDVGARFRVVLRQAGPGGPYIV